MSRGVPEILEGQRLDVSWYPANAQGSNVASSLPVASTLCTIEDPSGTQTNAALTGPTASGSFDASFVASAGGVWTARIHTVGSYEGAGEFTVKVKSSRIV